MLAVVFGVYEAEKQKQDAVDKGNVVEYWQAEEVEDGLLGDDLDDDDYSYRRRNRYRHRGF